MDGVTDDLTRPRSTAGNLASAGSLDTGRFPPGTILASRYRIVALLGRGGMGEVYRAEDLKLGQPVALKFLPARLEDDPRDLERFLGEIRTARLITHPNVCRVYDVADVDGRQFLTMEYVDGEDLASLLRRIGYLPQDKGLDIARQVCAGLAASHDAGILHRDLKPANIMLDGRGRVRITDFGLGAPLRDVAAGAGEIAGTPAYMAPEQFAGAPLSVQTDLYALGLLLYELFTGERVHTVTTTQELRERHQQPASAHLRPGVALDPGIRRVVERCLEPDPGRRPASAMAVAAALPGSDPLADALAAGVTPSPQVVAGAGAEGGLAASVAVPLLIGVFAALAAAPLLFERYLYTGYVSVPHSAVMLAAKAQEMTARLGYGETPHATASGFEVSPDFFRWSLRPDTPPADWSVLPVVRPPVVRFWHRSSPRPMAAAGYGTMFGALPVRPADPPRDVSGMTYMELDLFGQLVAFEAIPPQVEIPDEGAAPAPDWSRLFAEAGLDITRFSPVRPEWIGPYADARAAWVGPAPHDPGGALRIETAAYRGRPVMFRQVAPWTVPERVQPPATPGADELAFQLQIPIALGTFIVCLVLARSNVRQGRADLRGGVRLAFALGAMVLAHAVLVTQHVAAIDEFALLIKSVSLALFVGSFVMIFYVALEPYVRRRWPNVLISWARLLAGRWRDPQVGRDLLVGSLAGLVMNLLMSSVPYVSAWRGVTPAPPDVFTAWHALTGAAAFVGHALRIPPTAIIVAVIWLAMIFIFRIVLRSSVAAGTLYVAMAGGVLGLTNPTDPLAGFVLNALAFGIVVLILMHFGLLATVAAAFTTTAVLASNMSLQLMRDHPAFVASWAVVILLPALFGFYTSLAGRPMIPSSLLED